MKVKQNNSIFISIILLMLISSNCAAQSFEPIFKNILNLLPSQETYDIYQDSNGLIWISSDRGISKYDGSSCIFVPTEQYYKTKVIFQFVEESKNKVWISTLDDELFWFDPLESKTVFHPYEYNELLTEKLGSFHHNLIIQRFDFSEAGLLLGFKNYPTLLQINHQGIAQFLGDTETISQSLLDFDVLIKMYESFPYCQYVKRSGEYQTFKVLLNKDSDTIPIIENLNYDQTLTSEISSHITYEDLSLISVDEYLIVINKNEIIKKEFSSEILSIYADDNGIMVGTFDGVHKLDKDLNISESFLPNLSISSITRDRSGGFWFSTLEQGVFYTNNFDLRVFKDEGGLNPIDIFYSDGKIIFNNNNIEIISWNPKNNSFTNIKNVWKNGMLYRARKPNLNEYLGHSFDDFYKGVYNYVSNIKKKKYYGYGKVIRKFNADGSHEKIILEGDINVNHVLQVDHSKILLSTETGLYMMTDLSGLVKRNLKNINDDISLKKACRFKHGNAFLTNSGLIIENDNLNTYILGKNEGLNSDDLNGILTENDSTIWVYGYGGINEVIFSKNHFKVNSYSTFENLPSKDIISFLLSDTEAYIGTKLGLYKLNRNNIKESKTLNPANFHIDSIRTDMNLELIGDTIICSYDDNLSIFFKYLDYSDKEIFTEYNFDNNKNWILTNSNRFDLRTIKTGEFNLKLRIRFKDEKLLVKDIIIIVIAPFYKRTWFIIFVGTLMALSIFSVVLYFFNWHNNRKNEKVRLELELLTSRMNPHFTFNTISSIQSYILNNNRDLAIKYLADFALLMRKILEYSFTEKILLSDEIDFLNLYLELENKRFKKKFVLNVETSKNVNTNKVFIPVLILQPLIENVLIHSKYHKNQKNVILLHFKSKRTKYQITVQDYGMKVNGMNKNINHKSVGLELIQKRIKLYNQNRYENSDFIVESDKDNIGYSVKMCLVKK